jgi:hypothetical protein
MKLTKKQEWFIDYLRFMNKEAPGQFISPTHIGMQYGISLGESGLYRSTTATMLRNLESIGLVERNEKGHYRIKD